MLSALGISKASIRVIPYQSIIFLHPPAEFDGLDTGVDAPPKGDDPLLWGRIILNISKPKEIKSLVVKLETRYSILIPDHPQESGILSVQQVKLNSSDLMLEKGEHTFAFSLRVPRNSAPFERNQHGRVFHKLIATADGLGIGGGEIQDECGIDMIVNPAEEGQTSGLNMRIEGFQEETGPYAMTLTSQHVTVAGLVHFTLNLPSAPTELKIHNVSAHITQSYSLCSAKNPELTGSPTPHRRNLFLLDHRANQPPLPEKQPQALPAPVVKVSSPSTRAGLLAFLKEGDSLEVSHVARLPDDDQLRGTTQWGTQTPIRISHEVVMEVKFSRGDGKNGERLLRTVRPITISSCCCMLESLLLPSYSELDNGHHVKRPPRKHPSCAQVSCVCGMTSDSLLHELGDPTKVPPNPAVIPPEFAIKPDAFPNAPT